MTSALLRPMAGWMRIGLAALVAAAITAGSAAAQQPRTPVTAESVGQKAEFLGNLVTKSVSAQTIESSNDPEAKAALAKARSLVAAAKQDLAAGRLAQADGVLNEALALVNGQTRRLSQSRIADERLTDAYNKRLNSVKSFIQAYGRVAVEKGAGSAAARQRDALVQMVVDAESKARAGRLQEGKDILDRAYQLTTKEIRGLRQGDTLVRSLNFATPKDEYDYEIDRNDSHVMLLRIATGERPPTPQAAQQIVKLRANATELRRRADGQAAAGDYKAAIRSLEQSTSALLQAIRMSGLYIPG